MSQSVQRHSENSATYLLGFEKKSIAAADRSVILPLLRKFSGWISVDTRNTLNYADNVHCSSRFTNRPNIRRCMFLDRENVFRQNDKLYNKNTSENIYKVTSCYLYILYSVRCNEVSTKQRDRGQLLIKRKLTLNKLWKFRRRIVKTLCTYFQFNSIKCMFSV